MPSSNSTLTVQNVLDYARAHIFLKPLLGLGGVASEPGLSICNDVLQMLLSKPFAWKFNRRVANFFVTQLFVQDYPFAGACAFVLNPVTAQGASSSIGGGGAGIDLVTNNGITQSGFLVTVNCLMPHNFLVGQTVYLNGCAGSSAAAYNSVFVQSTVTLVSQWTNGYTITATPTPNQFQFLHSQSGLANSGAAGFSDYGWLESGVLLDINNNSVLQPTGPFETLDRLTPTSDSGPTDQLAMMVDYSGGGTPAGLSNANSYNGVLLFRVNPSGGAYSMAAYPVYQAKAPLLTTTGAFWFPWPDNLGYVLRAGVKAFAYQLTEKSFAEKEAQWNKFAAMAMQALSYADNEASNEAFAPRIPIMR